MFEFVRVESPELLEAVHRLRREVFGREPRSIAPAEAGGAREPDADDARSLHLAALDAGGKVAGTVRMIFDTGAQLPIARHGILPPPPGVLCAEVSRLAVARRDRRGAAGRWPRDGNGDAGHSFHLGDPRRTPEIVLGLWRAVLHESLRLGVGCLYAVMAEDLRRLMLRCRLPFEPVGDPFGWGGTVGPCRAEVPALVASILDGPAHLFGFYFGNFDPAAVAPRLRDAIPLAPPPPPSPPTRGAAGRRSGLAIRTARTWVDGEPASTVGDVQGRAAAAEG